MSADPKKKNITPIIINLLIITVLLAGAIRAIQYYNGHNNHKIESGKTSATSPEGQLLPIDMEAHRLIAEHYCATGRPEKALPHYKRLLVFRAKDRDLRCKFATASLDAENYKQAFEEFSLLSEEKQTDSLTPKIAAGKGIALFYLGRIPESKQELDLCLKQSPNTPEAVCFLGQIEATEGDTATASSLLEHTVSLDPTYVEGWYQLARFRMEHGNYRKAQQHLLRALTIDPLNGKCHARLGMIYYYLDNRLPAKKSYLTAIALNPRDFNTRYNLGELYYTAFADTENALREYNTTLKINPDHVDANFKVGLICLRNNMVKEAIRYFRTALKTDPENVRILLQLGVAYEKIGDQEHALKVYQKVIAVDALNSIAIQKIKYLSKK